MMCTFEKCVINETNSFFNACSSNTGLADSQCREQRLLTPRLREPIGNRHSSIGFVFNRLIESGSLIGYQVCSYL